MRYRHRRWYQMTGLPGWMRFGFSPGWRGRSPMGLGPAAQLTPDQELEILKTQAQQLENELEAIGKRIEELGGSKK